MQHAYLLPIALFMLSQTAVSQTCNNSAATSKPDSHFSVNGQEVTDLETGLIWKKCPVGKIGSDCASSDSTQQFNWAAALRAAETEAQKTGKAWRLPNIKELLSIVEENCYNPAIDLTIFPPSGFGIFWSASPNAASLDDALHVNFHYGQSGNDIKNSTLYVRLVRTGQ